MEINLESLVKSAAAGNNRAFADIVRSYKEMAYGYAYSILKDFHLAEDAVQEAFFEAYHNLKKLDNTSAFPSWLRRIVQYRCSRYLKRKRLPQAPLEYALSEESPDPGPHELAER